MDAIIRPAGVEDAQALAESCYPEADLQDVRDYLAWSLRQVQQGRMVRLVAEVDGRAVGNAQLTVWGGEGEIGSVVVAEGFRQQGLARRLIEALVAEARARGLTRLEIRVERDRPHIQAFYERLGFVAKETRNGGPSPSAVELQIWL